MTRTGRIVGALLTLPAFALWLLTLVVPTVTTLLDSFRTRTPFGSDARFVGFENYRHAFRAFGGFGYHRQLGGAAALIGLPLLVLVPLSLLLAWAAHRAGTGTRLVTRVALALPLACYAPVALALAWQRRGGEPGPGTRAPSAVTALLFTTFGLVCALGVTAYLAALRRRTAHRPVRAAVLTVSALAVAAAVAVAVQEFSYSYVTPRGADALFPGTPAVDIFRQSFMANRSSAGAAVAVLTFLPLAALGVAMTVLVTTTRLRLEWDPTRASADTPRSWTGGRVAALAGGAVLLVAVLAVAGYGLWPLLSHLFDGAAEGHPDAASILVNTWVPPSISTAVGVGTALLAGYGIGALRPLGERSELLLLPFAPWLFTGTGLFQPTWFRYLTDLDLVNSFAALVPPGWLCVAALVGFTVLFRGLAAPGRSPLSAQVLLPALPFVLGTGLAVLVVRAQGLQWPLAAVSEPRLFAAPVELLSQVRYGGQPYYPLVAPPLLLALLALGLAAYQVWYLDRLALRTGRSVEGDDQLDHFRATPPQPHLAGAAAAPPEPRQHPV